MIEREKVVKGLEIHTKPNSRCVGCPYPNNGLCGDQLYVDALALLKVQEPIDFHNMGFQDAEKILTYAGIGCDVLSPDGFIHWLKQQMIKDPRFMDELKRRDDDA